MSVFEVGKKVLGKSTKNNPMLNNPMPKTIPYI
jgi:hypothetical protein